MKSTYINVTSATSRVITDADKVEPWKGWPSFTVDRVSLSFEFALQDERLMINIDRSTSDVITFVDDLGTNLIRESGRIANVWVLEDRKRGGIEVVGGTRPNANAQAVEVECVIGVWVASGTRAIRSCLVPVNVGAIGVVNGSSFIVEEVASPSFSTNAVNVTLKLFSRLDSIAGFRFEDANGIPIPFESTVSKSICRKGEPLSWISQDFTSKIDAFVLVTEEWIDRERIIAPLRIRASIT